LAGLTAEFARDTQQDIELARDVMTSIPLDFQETQIELGEDKCEWTVSKTAKTYKREWNAWVKTPVCRHMVYPKYPYPSGMKWAQIKIWLKTPKGKAVYKKYCADLKIGYANAKQYKFIDRATCSKVKGRKSNYMIVPSKRSTTTMVKNCLLPYPNKDEEEKKRKEEERKKKEEEERKKKEEEEKRKKKEEEERKKKEEEERKKKEEEEKKKDDDSNDDDDEGDDDN